ncbi:uncharacterized protein V1516DRAFT_669086 [Lipomyces oligophaga]|uniref:uncharacterized protein n=1 Tax=Lipomyces oligophaga TaxID=45792 RepID=UPI0034CD6AAF
MDKGKLSVSLLHLKSCQIKFHYFISKWTIGGVVRLKEMWKAGCIFGEIMKLLMSKLWRTKFISRQNAYTGYYDHDAGHQVSRLNGIAAEQAEVKPAKNIEDQIPNAISDTPGYTILATVQITHPCEPEIIPMTIHISSNIVKHIQLCITQVMVVTYTLPDYFAIGYVRVPVRYQIFHVGYSFDDLNRRSDYGCCMYDLNCQHQSLFEIDTCRQECSELIYPDLSEHSDVQDEPFFHSYLYQPCESSSLHPPINSVYSDFTSIEAYADHLLSKSLLDSLSDDSLELGSDPDNVSDSGYFGGDENSDSELEFKTFVNHPDYFAELNCGS